MLRCSFRDFVELRRVLPSADLVTVASGRAVIIFNIKDRYRLITAIHFNRKIVFVLRLMTHSEYDKELWKRIL